MIMQILATFAGLFALGFLLILFTPLIAIFMMVGAIVLTIAFTYAMVKGVCIGLWRGLTKAPHKSKTATDKTVIHKMNWR